MQSNERPCQSSQDHYKPQADTMIPQVARSQIGGVKINPKQLAAFIDASLVIQRQIKAGLDWPRLELYKLSHFGYEHLLELKLRVEKFAGYQFDLEVNAAHNCLVFRPLMPEEFGQDIQLPVSNIATTGPVIIETKPVKIPRPANAFILFRQHWHPTIKAENPGLHNNDISVILGNKWRLEDEQIKAAWKVKAEEAKKQHAIDHPGYHYQPRKPSEKKRRMTKNKLAKLAATKPDTQRSVEQCGLPHFDPTALFRAALEALPEDEPLQNLEITNFYEPYVAPTDNLAIAQTGDAIGFHAAPVSDEAIAEAVQHFNNTFGLATRSAHSAGGISTANVIDGASYEYHTGNKMMPIPDVDFDFNSVFGFDEPTAAPILDTSAPQTAEKASNDQAEIDRQKELDEIFAVFFEQTVECQD